LSTVRDAERKGAATPSERLEIAVFDGDRVTVRALPATGSLSIGRTADNDVCIDNPAVSRRHAVLHIGPPLAIQDLGGANGTFVKDPTRRLEKGETHSLRQLAGATLPVSLGDCIVVGTTVIVVRRSESIAVGETGSEPVGYVAKDPAMLRLYEQAARAAASTISVLILGETGVGKEVFARAIHARSPRAKGPFLAINCGALPETLLESELFGHEKGAFSGAHQARPGLFESADGGTLFLDEVGELPASTQVKLLRVLEDKSVLPVGGRSPRSIDVRFVAATNRDPDAEVARGRLREDLLYRLNGFVLTIPALRERRTEILALARVFAAATARQLGRHAAPELSPETVALLERYAWPGNVRELRNVIDRAVVLATPNEVLPENLPSKLVAPSSTHRPSPGMPGLSGETEPPPPGEPFGQVREELRALERTRILDALERCEGNQTRAAEMLGMSRRTLVTRLGEYGVPRPRKRRE
jgi:DNA-binding NtrC family response regulator